MELENAKTSQHYQLIRQRRAFSSKKHFYDVDMLRQLIHVTFSPARNQSDVSIRRRKLLLMNES
jgi:hypothetical protein